MNSYCSCGGEMRPHEEDRKSFTWKCGKCGKTITQKKRLSQRIAELKVRSATSAAQAVRLKKAEAVGRRLCVGCKHFEIDLGFVDSYGIGHVGSLECRQKKFDESAPTDEFHRLIEKARTCDKFEVRSVS